MSKLTTTIEIQLWDTTAYSTTWTDITADVLIPGLKCFSGTRGTSILDRVSDIGTLTFDLNNSNTNSAKLAGYYSPGHTNARTGFDIGCPIRIRFTFEGLTRTKWYGRIYGIDPEPGTMLTRRTHITAYDWMYQANKYTLSLPSYEVNITMDGALRQVVSKVPIQPLGQKSISRFSYPFPAVFDNLKYKTTAMAEFQKLAQSEIGNIFLTHNLSGDEFVCGASKARRIPYSFGVFPSTSEYSLPTALCGSLLNEDGFALLNEDGSKLLVDQSAKIIFNNAQIEMSVQYASGLTNRVKVTTNPRTFSNTVQTLFSQTDPISIAAGESIDMKFTYRNPDSQNFSLCGKDIVFPVATTDYLFNTAADGTGTDITASLAITGDLLVNEADLTLKNNSASDGYITKMTIRGKPIQIYDAVSRVSEYKTLIDRYGLLELEYTMPYQPPPFTAQTIANAILENYSLPVEVVKSIKFIPRDDSDINRFLALDCDSRIEVKEDQIGVNWAYFVQGWDFNVLSVNSETGLIIEETLSLYRQDTNEIPYH